MAKYWKSGDPFVWLTGGALAFTLLMVFGLVLLILVRGIGQFWPADLVELRLKDGEVVLGEVWDREEVPGEEDAAAGEPDHRIRMKIGNRDVYGLDFRWIDEADIAQRRLPADAIAIERTEWGNAYGRLVALRREGRVLSTDPGTAWPMIESGIEEMWALRGRIERIEKGEIGTINRRLEAFRLAARRIELDRRMPGPEREERTAAIEAGIAELEAVYRRAEAERAGLYDGAGTYVLTLATADGTEREIRLFDVVRIYRPNRMGVGEKARLYAAKAWEFVSGDPRESNTEGGIFPALFGTVMMVLLMTIAVVPLGVLAAIYLREYARQGTWVRLIRIAVNNLAGVPSIVYGIFGLGFFVYAVGGTIDRVLFPESLPTPTFGTGGILWASLTLALLTVPVVIVATEEGLAAVPRGVREGSLALSATKFETLWRIVIPGALPGILTGVILAVARAAGEVAPLMITGVVKLAPALPLDGEFPFVHLERKFMHLGFHIYDVGFQSPNVEAAIPMVYSTTLLLLLIVILLNVAAIAVRNRLRKKVSYAMF